MPLKYVLSGAKVRGQEQYSLLSMARVIRTRAMIMRLPASAPAEIGRDARMVAAPPIQIY